MNRRTHRLGVAALAFTGILFGTTFLMVGSAIERADVAPFLAVRFLIGALVLAPFAFRRPTSLGIVRDGVLAGSCLLIAYALQTVGLHDVSPASSAFITYLLIVVVPLVVAIRTGRPPSRAVLAGVALAVAGLWLLSGGASGFGRGEALTLGSAVMFGLHIVVLGEVAGRHDSFRLTFWQLLTVSIGCFLPPLLGGGDLRTAFDFDGGVWIAILVCGVGASAIAFLLMSWAQRVVAESLAAIVLLLEPVSAAILGELTGDRLGWRGLAGASVILAAVLVTEMLDRSQPMALGAEVVVVPDADPSPPDASFGLRGIEPDEPQSSTSVPDGSDAVPDGSDPEADGGRLRAV